MKGIVTMRRESIRKRKRSFWAMLAAVLIVFNMMPMNLLANTIHRCNLPNDRSSAIVVNAGDVIDNNEGTEMEPAYGSGSIRIDGHIVDNFSNHYSIYTITGRSYKAYKDTLNGVQLISLYNVTFDTNGGSAVATQQIEHNDKAAKPADPTKAGDTFVKWVKVKNGVETDFSFNTPITEDTTLRAKWGNGNSDHVHSYTWKVSKEPTVTSDGEEIYVCECGHIARTNILPGSAAFEADIIAKIKKAPVNGIVTIETRIWNSLSKNVRDALVERPDVTLKISFLSEGYKGIPLKVTIPTGIDRYALWDEKGWLGLCRAGSTLGYDQ